MMTVILSFLTTVEQMWNKLSLSLIATLRPLQNKVRQIPGPKGLPFFGNLFQMDSDRIQHSLTQWSKSYGSIFKIKLLGKNVVAISDAELLRKAFHKEPVSFHTNDRGLNSSQYVFYGRKHVGFADLNSETVRLREILRRNVLMYLMGQERFERVTRKSIHTLQVRMAHAKTINSDLNPDESIKDFLTDLNSEILMGETLPENDPDRNALWELINCLYLLIEPSNDGPLRAMPFLRHLPGKHGRLFRSTIKARDRVAQRYFDTQKSTFQEGRTRGLIDVCLQMQADGRREDGEFWLTDEYIKGLVYDTVVAGMTEMMKSLRILVLLMCHYQDIQSRVHTEISDVIRDDTPSCSHRQEMPYTQAVILEMLRYVSQTPLAIPHKCNKDIILDGYLIEKDSGILPNIWGIHHDEEVWGDPWVFRPDRFLDENSQLIPKDHKLMKSLIPFSVGKRRCPGENFAMSRTFLTFVSLLQQLRFTPPEDQELPSADPRLYTNKYPLHLPEYTCRAVPRREKQSS